MAYYADRVDQCLSCTNHIGCTRHVYTRANPHICTGCFHYNPNAVVREVSEAPLRVAPITEAPPLPSASLQQVVVVDDASHIVESDAEAMQLERSGSLAQEARRSKMRVRSLST
jgi:hypothetical protein